MTYVNLQKSVGWQITVVQRNPSIPRSAPQSLRYVNASERGGGYLIEFKHTGTDLPMRGDRAVKLMRSNRGDG